MRENAHVLANKNAGLLNFGVCGAVFLFKCIEKKPSHVCVLDCKRPLKITAFQGIVNLNEYVQRVASPSAQRQ